MQAVSIKFKPAALAASLLLGTLSLNAHATLTSYTSDGKDLVYSSVSNVTWTKDANLFKTMYDADNTLVSKILAVSSTYDDPAWSGIQTLTEDDFYSGKGRTVFGGMTWWGALFFVNYLNHISYGGSNQWYLPTVANIPSRLGVFTTPNGTAKGDELVELFYQELGGTDFYPKWPWGTPIPNTANFDNFRAFGFWSGTEYALGPKNEWWQAWQFVTYSAALSVSPKYYLDYYAWAVSPGQVAAVPEPESVALLLAGLGVVGGVVRRRKLVA